MCFDDIMLYEGAEKPKAVGSGNKLASVWSIIKISTSENPYMKYPGGHKGTRFEKGLLSYNIPF